MTTETQALAVREWSLAEVGRRVDIAKAAGWGLQGATPQQLNNLALYCQKRQLLPGDEVILYEGNPFITVDGHVTLMRRDHKGDYCGFSQRPLPRNEKEDWGYDPDDLVIETTIRSVSMGEIKAHGKVSADERNGRPLSGHRTNPVARFNPVEMAQKRSLVRAHRFAYGLDSYVDDEAFDNTVRTVVQERNDPERVARESARYDRIVGDFYPDEHSSAASSPAPRSDEASEDESPASSDALVKRKDHPLWVKWQETERAARAHNLDQDTSTVRLGQVTEAQLAASITTLQDVIDSVVASAGPEQAEF